MVNERINFKFDLSICKYGLNLRGKGQIVTHVTWVKFYFMSENMCLCMCMCRRWAVIHEFLYEKY